MGRKRKNVTESDVESWIAKGLGQGDGQDAKPWIGVRDFASRGRSSRCAGYKTGRTHHLFSDIELWAFLAADYSPLVIEIREQRALLPRGETIEIAAELDIKHPCYPGTRVPTVMTSDLLLTVNIDGEHREIVWDCKRVSDLQGSRRSRTLQKLEIARRFWMRRNITWWLVTDKEFDPKWVKNLEWIHSKAALDKEHLTEMLPAFLAAFARAFRNTATLKEILRNCQRALGCAAFDDVDCLFRHAAWTHAIEVDLTVPVHLSAPVKLNSPDRQIKPRMNMGGGP